MLWHNSGCGMLAVPDIYGSVRYVYRLGGEEIFTARDGDILKLEACEKRYLITEMKPSELKAAFEKSILTESDDK